MPEKQSCREKEDNTILNYLSKPKTNWFVFYTNPKAEKKVYNELVSRGYEVFLPTIKTFKVWKNRQKKWIEQVIFPGYIFVNTQQYELYNIVQIQKVVTYIHCAGKPSVISPKEIEFIKIMLNMGHDISVEREFYKGEKVRIIYGPLAGKEGVLTKKAGKKRFGIQLAEINHTVFIDINIAMLEKVN